jgi:ABC-type amino acid transport substrate-binding protein
MLRLATWLIGIALTGLATAGAADAPVRIAFGTSLAPYVIEQPPSGIELDLIRLALQKAGLNMAPRFYPQARAPMAFAAGEVDAAATVTPDGDIKAAYSDVYIEYEDVAITLRDRALTIATPDDLAGHSVAAFQNARQYLGERYRQAVTRSTHYQEFANQIDQNRLLYGDGVDVVISDRHIFSYLDRQLAQSKFPQRPRPVDIHPILGRIAYRVGFHDPALRDRFNQGLAQITPAEREAIFAAYAYRPNRGTN